MSRILIAAGFAVAATCCAAGGAQAQAPPSIRWHLMGGYGETLGTTADYLQGGAMIGGGFTLTPSRGDPLDLRFDLSYSEHNASTNLINAGQQSTNVYIDGGNGQIWSANGNLVYNVPFMYGVRAYGIAGVGVYHARVELTQSDPLYGGYFYCDPFSGYCDGGYGSAVVESNGVTKFGWNAGIGVEFDLPFRRSWFIEARYHRIDTSTPIEYIPITVGYRF